MSVSRNAGSGRPVAVLPPNGGTADSDPDVRVHGCPHCSVPSPESRRAISSDGTTRRRPNLTVRISPRLTRSNIKERPIPNCRAASSTRYPRGSVRFVDIPTAYGTVRYVLYPSRVTERDEPQYIESSSHRWNARTGAIETWMGEFGPDLVDRARGGGEWWYVTVRWHAVDGAPTPTSFEVRSSRGKPRDELKAINRDLTKRLPLGRIVTEGLEQLIAFHDGVTLALNAGTAERRATSEMLHSKGQSRMEEVYRLAYDLNSTAKAQGHRHPSRWAWEQLGLKGITDSRGESPSYELVRTKWIPKGKALAKQASTREEGSDRHDARLIRPNER